MAQGRSCIYIYTYTPRCTSIERLMVSIRRYLGFLKGQLGGVLVCSFFSFIHLSIFI